MNRIGEVLLGTIFTTSDTQHWLIPVLLVLAIISWFLWKKSKKRLRHIFFLGLLLSLIGVTVKSTTVVSSTLSDLFTNNETTTTTSGSAAKKKTTNKQPKNLLLRNNYSQHGSLWAKSIRVNIQLLS